MSNLLELKHVSKKYENFSLEDVSFTLPAGYIMGFVGVNGAGKTTTLNIILNTIEKEKGIVQVFGKDHVKDEVIIKQQLGVVLDHIALVKEWDLRDVEKAYQLFYDTWDSKKYYRYLEKFSLSPHMKVEELSRGMGTKLLVATALAHETKLLILDEPTTGLDPAARDELITLFQEYIEDGTRSILFSTHITKDLESIADYMTCIHNGRVYYTGTIEGLLERYRLVKGGPDEYKRYEDYIIGLRKKTTGFEGLVLTSNVARLGKGIRVEQPSIDDIIIFMKRGEK